MPVLITSYVSFYVDGTSFCFHSSRLCRVSSSSPRFFPQALGRDFCFFPFQHYVACIEFKFLFDLFDVIRYYKSVKKRKDDGLDMTN